MANNEITKMIINEISGIHVVCGRCNKSHFGRQTYNFKLKDYICDDCEVKFKENK